MKKGIKFVCIIGAILVAIVAVGMIVSYALGIEGHASDGELKTPLEWAKEEIASDEKYEGQHVMFAVIPVEDSTLKDNEALYFIIAITEESELVMDWYGVHLKWEEYKPTFKDGLRRIYSTNSIIERFSRDQVKVDATLFKTEIIGDDGVILDYDDGKIIGDNGEVVIGGNSQTFGEGE